eukprot:11047161-Ditylum_brightwellii.AAC.1
MMGPNPGQSNPHNLLIDIFNIFIFITINNIKEYKFRTVEFLELTFVGAACSDYETNSFNCSMPKRTIDQRVQCVAGLENADIQILKDIGITTET